MQLYNEDTSPYCSRVRIQIYHKGLSVDITPTPGGLGSEQYRAVAPLGRVPALKIDGRLLAESLAIMEYLEDRFPAPHMRPEAVEERAQMRAVSLANDNYAMPPLRKLFESTRGGEAAGASPAEAAADLERMLGQIQALLGRGRYASGDILTLADCTLVPTLHYTQALSSMLDLDSPLTRLPRLQAWWDTVCGDPAVERVRQEIDTALKARAGS